MYATIPEDPGYAFFLNLHTHKDVDKVIVFYQELNSPDPTSFMNITAETYPSLTITPVLSGLSMEVIPVTQGQPSTLQE